MNQDPDDPRFQTLFGELRWADEEHAPAFSTLVDAAVGRAHKAQQRRHPRRLAAAITAPIVAAVLLILARTGSLAPRQAETVPVFRWQSPTAGLLTPVGAELLSEIPQVDESLQPIDTDITK